MSQTLQLIMALVERQDVLISEHGYDELAADDILVKDLMAGSVMLRWSKIIPTIIRDHVCLSYKEISKADQSMWCGVFRSMPQPCSRCDSL